MCINGLLIEVLHTLIMLRVIMHTCVRSWKKLTRVSIVRSIAETCAVDVVTPITATPTTVTLCGTLLPVVPPRTGGVAGHAHVTGTTGAVAGDRVALCRIMTRAVIATTLTIQPTRTTYR